LKQLEDTVAAYKKEIGTELFSQLTKTERDELTQLNEDLAKLKEELVKSSTERADVIICYFLYFFFFIH
jgi:hypothetical protein